MPANRDDNGAKIAYDIAFVGDHKRNMIAVKDAKPSRGSEVGGQSSGKSPLLIELTGVKFPVSAGICTRAPLDANPSRVQKFAQARMEGLLDASLEKASSDVKWTEEARAKQCRNAVAASNSYGLQHNRAQHSIAFQKRRYRHDVMMLIFLVLPCGDISGGRAYDSSARRRALRHRLLLDGQGEPREAHGGGPRAAGGVRVQAPRQGGGGAPGGGQEPVLHDVMMMIIIISW